MPQDEFLEFTRDAVGRNVERSFRKGQGKPGGFVLRQDYDPLHRLVSQWAGLGGAPAAVTAIAERQYRYDPNGNPAEIIDTHWGTSRYSYDRDGCIAAVHRENGASEEFQHDSSGNISGVLTNAVWLGRERINVEIPILEHRQLGPGGRLEQIRDTRYLYDQDGRVIEKREQRPGVPERVWQYEWTSEGQLRSVINADGEVWRYEYDAFGRRTKKTGPDNSTTYVWDGDVVAEEIRETHASRTTSSWVFEPNSFCPVAKLENGKGYACVLDQIGTPRELVSSTGELAWSAQFSAWGELESQSADKTECSIRFQGQWYDEESGLHYNFHRHYDPETGLYLSPDPIGLLGGTHPYGYVRNPLAWIDPLGLACDPLQKLADRGFTGVKRNANGGLDYSDSNALYRNPGRLKPDGTPVQSIVKIKYTGDYGQDFEAANQAGFGQKSTPSLNGDKYTWHHVDDYDPQTGEGTMQLVRQDAHNGIPHTGGVSQYENATGNPYTFKGW